VRDYEYELRHDDAVIATGRIPLEEPPQRGELLSLGTRSVRVEDVLELGRTPRLILEQS
jgi:hypothetical protein